MATAEQNHELGREGVFRVKAWLEATTQLSMPWNVYNHTTVCTRTRLDGGVKRYDVFGKLPDVDLPVLSQALKLSAAQVRDLLGDADRRPVLHLVGRED